MILVILLILGVKKKITFSKSFDIEIDGVTVKKIGEFWIIMEDGKLFLISA